MSQGTGVEAGCLVVGDFIDEADVPPNLTIGQGEAVRPQILADYLDARTADDVLREFTVLLKDGRVVVVRGHALKHEPHAVAGQDVFSVVLRTPSNEILIALFKSDEVSGIFHGDLQNDRKIA